MYIHSYMCINIYAHLHTHIYTLTHTHTHKYTRISIHYPQLFWATRVKQTKTCTLANTHIHTICVVFPFSYTPTVFSFTTRVKRGTSWTLARWHTVHIHTICLIFFFWSTHTVFRAWHIWNGKRAELWRNDTHTRIQTFFFVSLFSCTHTVFSCMTHVKRGKSWTLARRHLDLLPAPIKRYPWSNELICDT